MIQYSQAKYCNGKVICINKNFLILNNSCVRLSFKVCCYYAISVSDSMQDSKNLQKAYLNYQNTKILFPEISEQYFFYVSVITFIFG